MTCRHSRPAAMLAVSVLLSYAKAMAQETAQPAKKHATARVRPEYRWHGPRWMERHEGINARVKEGNVDLLMIGDSFLRDGRRMRRDMAPDGTHPNEKGYAAWAKAMEPMVAKLMGETCAADMDRARMDAVVKFAEPLPKCCTECTKRIALTRVVIAERYSVKRRSRNETIGLHGDEY